jgi:hypothetical protein
VGRTLGDIATVIGGFGGATPAASI